MCHRLKNAIELSSYKLLHACFVACSLPGSSKKKTLECSCHVCKRSGVRARLHACLSCVFIGCLKHFKGHEKNQEEHEFGMDLSFGAIYCFRCEDYTYDSSSQIKESTQWLPPVEDGKPMEFSIPAKMNQSLVGLKGIPNLGLTCYISCIIQVFANTPMMRNYFLSGRHTCLEKNDCPVCMLSGIFQEIYSGKATPLRLHNLVNYVWNKSHVFLGRKSCDAYEFYDFYLNHLHEKEDLKKHLDCRCVIHQIFYGKYLNVKGCTDCDGGVSSSVYFSAGITLLCLDEKVKLTDCIENKCVQGIECSKLNPEKGEYEPDKCSKCDKIEKEWLHFKVLPNVLCFHCQAKDESKESEKYEVIFPKYLNMSQYDPENGSGTDSFERCQSSKNMYILYAIVCHTNAEKKPSAKKSKSKNLSDSNNVDGHYYAYVRKGEDVWYLCDDDVLERVDFKKVSTCKEGRLFFYIKEVLEYEQ